MHRRPFPDQHLALFNTLATTPQCMRGPDLTARLQRHWLLCRSPAPLPQALDTRPGVIAAETLPWEEPLYAIHDGVAYLSINGPMLKGVDDFTAWLFECASIDRIQRSILEIEQLAPRALVLLVNSPGGSAMGTPELGAQIADLDTRIPVFAYTGDQACSGAYWAMSSARLIFATPSSMVGSIGTYLALYDYSQMLASMGVSLDLFRAGELKGIGVMGKSLTDAERTYLSGSVARINTRFTGHVRAMRGDIAESTMQGQWFDGEEAVTLGLADATVSGLPELIAAVQAEL